MEAWSLSYQLNLYLPKEKAVTPYQLLGRTFDGKDAPKGGHPRTEAEFKKYKKELTKVAKWHESVLKDVRKGKKVAKPVDSHELLIDKHSKKT